MTSLTYVDLFANNVEGGIPSSIDKLCNLKFFRLVGNNMTGSLPECLEGMENCLSKSPLPSLQFLTLANNQLHGILPDWLGQLKNLVQLDLEYNSLQVNESHFSKLTKLKFLHLSSNSFTLNVSSNWALPFQIQYLDMGSCHLGPSFPTWLKSQEQVTYLVFSNASISGSTPSWFWEISSNFSLLNVSFNQLSGQLPNPLNVAPYADVDLSSNLFEGPISLPVVETVLLDLSNNRFFGPIPIDMGASMPNLLFLSLSSNNITGNIPASLGDMNSNQVIDLLSNNLTGNITASIGNCSYLKVLDVGGNNLYGGIPNSLGASTMKKINLVVCMKNQPQRFTKTLSLLTSLVVLNLSRNHISGQIPNSISNLRQLSSLDLSSNSLSGPIPPSMSLLSFLGVLNLSYNNFSGAIPYASHMTTFEAPSFVGNPGLCGAPLVVKCPGEGIDVGGTIVNDSEDNFIDNWFYLSIGLGFAAGILVPYFILAIRKSWRNAYYAFVDEVVDKLSFVRQKTNRS
ncbi:receptor-like protein eix1 [Quercus suber]|uniref:Receptor-like protein eix1 n=1 Tax=Quercus suber TaxID=58331 RepID=A0AAW0K6Z2_QUESU